MAAQRAGTSTCWNKVRKAESNGGRVNSIPSALVRAVWWRMAQAKPSPSGAPHEITKALALQKIPRISTSTRYQPGCDSNVASAYPG